MVTETVAGTPPNRTHTSGPELVERVRLLLDEARKPYSDDERTERLDELLELHAALGGEERRLARQIETAFLLMLRPDPPILENAAYRDFVSRGMNDEEFCRVPWQSVEEVIQATEVLYGFQFKEAISPDQLTNHVRALVRHALNEFERLKETEVVFELLQRAPIPPHLMDAELMRVRNRLYLYEQRRVRNKRRWLYSFLLLQTFLVLLLFPLLFIRAENGELQKELEAATGVDVDVPQSEARQYLGFADGLYWSMVTYSSIGYGDIAPVTRVGKALASVHGIMGVLATGIVAGLILNWLTPRDLA